jgi:hypothetical protein
MAKNITYLLGAGASAYALPTIKWMHLRMRFFYELLLEAYKIIGENRADPYDFSRDGYLLKFLDQIKQAGTPDVVIRMMDIRGEASNLARTFLAAYVLFEQLDECEDSGDIVVDQSKRDEIWKQLLSDHKVDEAFDEAYLSQTIDYRYLSLFSTFLNPSDNSPKIPSNVSFLTWNYDHQIERTLKLLDEKTLATLQKKHGIIPHTAVDDKEWDELRCNEEYSEKKVLKINGTAGFIPSTLWGGFDVTQDKLCKRTWRRFLNLIYGYRETGVIAQKIMLAWDTQYKVVNYIRREAAKVMKESDIVVVIGYSFPDFNRHIDNAIFTEFNGKLIIQSPSAEKMKRKFKGVKPSTSAIETITDVDSFFIPHEFWEN